jgi:hypothetical protein
LHKLIEAPILEVLTSGPLTFTDPKSMLEECIAGTGVTQVISWGVKEMLADRVLIDLFPDWHGELFPLFAFHPSRKHPPAKVRTFVDFCVDCVGSCGGNHPLLAGFVGAILVRHCRTLAAAGRKTLRNRLCERHVENRLQRQSHQECKITTITASGFRSPR